MWLTERCHDSLNYGTYEISRSVDPESWASKDVNHLLTSQESMSLSALMRRLNDYCVGSWAVGGGSAVFTVTVSIIV